MERVLLVHTMNGKPLSDTHGFPLWLIAPSKYGYKNPKATLEMEYVAEQQGGLEQNRTLLTRRNHPARNRSPSGIQ